MSAASKAEQNFFSVFLEDPNDLEITSETIKGLNITPVELLKGGVREAIETFSQKRSPAYLIVDISKSDLPVSDLSRLLEVCEPGISIIAVGLRNDVGLYRDLMKLGIFEYLVSPLFSEILARALKGMLFADEAVKEHQGKVGKVIAVAGARGGIGSTFIATNFAAILSGEKSRRVVLVDLDLHFGTLSLYLNVKPNYGLRDALEDPERIDQVFLERLLTPVSDRFFILSSEEPLEEQLKYKIDGVENLINILSKLFHYVIIDMPHYSNIITQKIIGNANIMLLITNPSLAGIRDAGRLLRLFGEEGAGRRVIIVMNKFGESEKNELKINDFDETLKHKVEHIIPYDSSIPMKYINQGKTLINEDNPIAKSIREIVDDLFGIRKPDKKPGVVESFLKKIKLK